MTSNPAVKEPQRIAVISTASSQPRHHRRVGMLLDAGYDVAVYAFRREYYGVNRYPVGAKVVELGGLQNGGYASRLPRLAAGARLVRKLEREQSTPAVAMYCFGFDSGLLGLLARSRREAIVYEVGDLRPLHFRGGMIGRLFRASEGALLKRSAALVVTAPAFLRDYYAAQHADVRPKAIVIENRLSQSHFAGASRPAPMAIRSGRIRIGIVGFLRYPRALSPLLKCVAARPERFELHVHGDGPLRGAVEDAAARCENIAYHGSFRSPADLEGIYQQLDANYVVYDNQYPNVRLLLPNKLYESIFFGVPMIVAPHTALAERVTRAGVGVVTDSLDEEAIGATLDQLDPDRLVAMSRCASHVPVSELVEDRAAILSDIARRLEIGSASPSRNADARGVTAARTEFRV